MNKIEFLYNKDKYQGIDSSKALSHYGILGQKWGQRRWQNADGTFNEAGKERYFGPSGTTKKNKEENKTNKRYNKKGEELAHPDDPNDELTVKRLNEIKKQYQDQKIGSIFNKKNVSYNDPKYNPYIGEENKIWDNVKEQQSKNWAKDKELINDLAGKELKYYDEDPILLEYYSNIKADIANEMKEKYPSIESRTFRMNALHAENEPFVSGYDGQEELREQYKELHEKAKKYPPRSAKRVKLEGEAALINAKEELNQKKIEEELNENVKKYIKENKNNILQDIDRIREKIKDINIVDDYGDYYVTRALEEHNKKKYNNFNEKGLKDLSDDEWDDVKNIAKAEYKDDISMQNKWFNDQKIGSSFNSKKFEKEANKLDKQFKSKYGDREYYDSNKIDEWLDRDENKKMEEAYASIMDKAFGEKSKEIKEIFKDYDDHNEEYVSKAAICDALSYGDDLDEIASEVHWFLTDDGDQGDRNSHAYYMHEKGYTPEQVAQKDREAQAAWNEGSTVAKQLSRYYNPTTLYMKNELQNEIFDQVNNRYNKKDDYSIYRISEAADSSGQFIKDHVKVANDFSKKLAPSCSDGNGWYYFNQAIQNLNMGAVDYRNITPADWDKINAEINKLKQ